MKPGELEVGKNRVFSRYRSRLLKVPDVAHIYHAIGIVPVRGIDNPETKKYQGKYTDQCYPLPLVVFSKEQHEQSSQPDDIQAGKKPEIIAEDVKGLNGVVFEPQAYREEQDKRCE